MTQAEKQRILDAIQAYTRKVTASPEAALRALVAEGIYLPNGELAKEYRDDAPA